MSKKKAVIEKVTNTLAAAGRKATGWKTTVLGVLTIAVAGYAIHQGFAELGGASALVGLGLIFGIDDPQ